MKVWLVKYKLSMTAKNDGATSASRLALQTAIITAIIGPVVLLVAQHFLEPRLIEHTKESISTVSVSDDRIRELFRSLLLVETHHGGRATGFLLAPNLRFVVSAVNLASDVNEPATVIRLKGSSDEITDSGHVSVIDKETMLAFVDMGKKLAPEFALSMAKSDVKSLDKIFTIGYARGNFPVLREGRIASLDYKLESRRFISADLPWEPGMAGSPVFDKSGQVIGVLSAGFPDSSIAVITPITQVLQSLEKLGNQYQ